MFLGIEFLSGAVLLKLHWPIVDLALTLSICELSLKLRSCSSQRLTKYPFSWCGQSMLLMRLSTSCNLVNRLLLLKDRTNCAQVLRFARRIICIAWFLRRLRCRAFCFPKSPRLCNHNSQLVKPFAYITYLALPCSTVSVWYKLFEILHESVDTINVHP